MAHQKTILSKQFSLQWRDALRGLILAVITAVLTPVLQSFAAGELTINWPSMLNVAIITAAGYILKNYFEPAKVIVPTTNDEGVATNAVVKQAVK